METLITMAAQLDGTLYEITEAPPQLWAKWWGNLGALVATQVTPALLFKVTKAEVTAR